jgi:mono/diheme cytochrome c family protein
MKLIRPALLVLPLTAVALLVLSFTYQQAKPMAVFKAPPSADAVTNPLKGDANATLAGGKIYKQQCAACHGEKGKGDGAAAAALSKPAANHTSAAVQKQTDGAIFWKITNGNTPMPGYKFLPEAQRWQLVNFIRTLAK